MYQDVNLRDHIFGHHLALYLSRLLDIFGSPIVPITVLTSENVELYSEPYIREKFDNLYAIVRPAPKRA